MKSYKMISFIGLEQSDIPYYLACELEQKKLRVLVVDNSFSHDLFKSIKKAETNTDYQECGRIVYIQNVAYSNDFFEKFDVVIIYHGYNVDEKLLETSDKIVVYTNYFKDTAEMFFNYIDVDWINENIPAERTIMLFRDKLSNKIAEEYIQHRIGITEISEEYVISFDEGNLINYFNFTYNGKQKRSGISGEMKSFIDVLKNFVLGKKNKKSKTEVIE